MRRRVFTAAAAAAFSVCMSITAFAGQWRQDSNGWWYQNDDGSYPAGTWQWIDSNGDGTAECYYFYADGYMAYNNDIDGYLLNNDGQWEAGGRVQTRSVSGSSGSASGGRDMTYASYARGINALYSMPYDNSPDGWYGIYMAINPGTFIDRGDCFEVTGVTVDAPYEYATEAQAKEARRALLRTEAGRDYAAGNTTLNPNGTYSIFGMDDMVYSRTVWSGSVYIRKDALLQFWDYDSGVFQTKTLASEYARRLPTLGQWSSIHCVIVNVDDNGYITKLREAQWG